MTSPTGWEALERGSQQWKEGSDVESALGDQRKTPLKGSKKDRMDQAGTLRIKDVDTGKEFVMHKTEASALLTAHHATRKIVKDAATGTPLTVDRFVNEVGLPNGKPHVHVHAKGGQKEFKDLRVIQTLNAHEGAIWTLEFSKDGKFLATAGQDRIVRVWKTLLDSKRRGDNLFDDAPVRLYKGHRGDILDLCWSHTDWLLSSSMDKTVRLWYTTMEECLRIFMHQDFVTSISFNPVDDKYFVSGSLDGKIRLWNIPDLKVVDWVDIGEMVTSCTFTPDGTRAFVGTHKGSCHSYGMEGFKFEYSHQIQIKNARSSKGVGRKITGLDVKLFGEEERLLVTSNDSRLRLYDSEAVPPRVLCKFKGHHNQNAQIQATFSSDGEFFISGSEQPDVFIWRANMMDVQGCCAGPTQKQRAYEKFHTEEQHVTVAKFVPDEVRNSRAFPLERLTGALGRIIVSTGYTGKVHVFENISAK